MVQTAVRPLQHPAFDVFVAIARQVVTGDEDATDKIERLRPAFERLLATPGWLPAPFNAGFDGGMGGGIGQWLLYRDAADTLSIFSLVVPSGSATPVHNHLAWGLIGLYAGAQEEEVFQVEDAAAPASGERPVGIRSRLTRRLQPGDWYALLPPDNDVHRVRTVSAGPSISIHVLGRDIGCLWRDRFDPAAGRATPFRSGYSNLRCDGE